MKLCIFTPPKRTLICVVILHYIREHEVSYSVGVFNGYELFIDRQHIFGGFNYIPIYIGGRHYTWRPPHGNNDNNNNNSHNKIEDGI